MSAFKKSLDGYKKRMTLTGGFTLWPLDLFPYFWKKAPFLLLFSPLIIIPFAVTVSLGALAAIAQTLFLPFQLIVSAVEDCFPPSNEGSGNNPNVSTRKRKTLPKDECGPLIQIGESKSFDQPMAENTAINPRQPKDIVDLSSQSSNLNVSTRKRKALPEDERGPLIRIGKSANFDQTFQERTADNQSGQDKNYNFDLLNKLPKKSVNKDRIDLESDQEEDTTKINLNS
jgi:hypothetical protein